jgi:hypothetical protein
MPYYIGQEMLEWDEYRGWEDTRGGEQPLSLFKFIDPSEAKTTVLPFSAYAGTGARRASRTAAGSCACAVGGIRADRDVSGFGCEAGFRQFRWWRRRKFHVLSRHRDERWHGDRGDAASRRNGSH